MAHRVVMDVESRSETDLLSTGAYRYARCPTTELLCLGYKIDMQVSKLIVFNWGSESAETVLNTQPHLWDRMGTIEELADVSNSHGAVNVAHNAEFEIETMAPRLPQLNVREWTWSDTAARGRAIGLPGKLEHAAEVLAQVHKKNPKGYATMLQCCKPKPTWKKKGTGPKWFEDAVRFGINFDYCLDDVEAEAEIDRTIPELTDIEYERWQRVLRQNRHGLHFDMAFVNHAVNLLDWNENLLLAEIPRLTNNAITSPRQVAETISWLGSNSVFVEDLQAKSVKNALKNYPHMDARCRRVLEIRQQLSKASTSKYRSIQKYACDDNTAKGMVIYHGAHTGRPTGGGPQPLNFIKAAKGHDANEIIPLAMASDVAALEKLGGLQNALASCLRGSITPRRGKIFRVADYASIEARGVLWMAGDERALDLFRSGADIYLDLAADIYGYVCTKEGHPEERQSGKIGVLGCGYQIGGPKLKTTAKDQWEVEMTLAFAKTIVDTYRAKYPRVPIMWRAVGNAAVAAIRDPGGLYETHKCWFYYHEGWLQITIPSGRTLHYPRTTIEEKEKPWGPTDQIVYTSTFQGRIVRKETYGGKLVENIVQAFCRDIMLEGEARLEAAGYEPLLNVYDESVCECDIDHGSVAELEAILAQPPEWCADMPIAAEGYESYRYRKG